MTSSPHGPYALGGTHATMAGTMGSEAARRSEAIKAGPSSDRGLQFAPVKSESLVIADQPRRGEYCPSLVHTARQATGAGSTLSRGSNSLRREGRAHREPGNSD